MYANILRLNPCKEKYVAHHTALCLLVLANDCNISPMHMFTNVSSVGNITCMQVV